MLNKFDKAELRTFVRVDLLLSVMKELLDEASDHDAEAGPFDSLDGGHDDEPPQANPFGATHTADEHMSEDEASREPFQVSSRRRKNG